MECDIYSAISFAVMRRFVSVINEHQGQWCVQNRKKVVWKICLKCIFPLLFSLSRGTKDEASASSRTPGWDPRWLHSWTAGTIYRRN